MGSRSKSLTAWQSPCCWGAVTVTRQPYSWTCVTTFTGGQRLGISRLGGLLLQSSCRPSAFWAPRRRESERVVCSLSSTPCSGPSTLTKHWPALRPQLLQPAGPQLACIPGPLVTVSPCRVVLTVALGNLRLRFVVFPYEVESFHLLASRKLFRLPSCQHDYPWALGPSWGKITATWTRALGCQDCRSGHLDGHAAARGASTAGKGMSHSLGRAEQDPQDSTTLLRRARNWKPANSLFLEFSTYYCLTTADSA